MVARFLAVVAGIGGAILGSQAPAFTHHYMQNLNGRIDVLRPAVEAWDRKFEDLGYTREMALADCDTETGIDRAWCSEGAALISTFEILTAHMARLQAANVSARPLLLMRDYAREDIVREITLSTKKEFKPGVPATLDGAAYAGGGFAVLWGGLTFIFGLLGALLGGGRRA